MEAKGESSHALQRVTGANSEHARSLRRTSWRAEARDYFARREHEADGTKHSEPAGDERGFHEVQPGLFSEAKDSEDAVKAKGESSPALQRGAGAFTD